ncbi:MAG: hypothetical protein KDB14_17225 [Planctomycetales bacterium]|nr:hypothetical protein [Planctomycetales bacterium]
MEFNRNQFFLAGLVLLFLGYQFRQIESFTLNERASRFIEARMQSARAAVNEFKEVSYREPVKPFDRQVTPPRWLALAMMAIGSVLCMHSFTMPKP